MGLRFRPTLTADSSSSGETFERTVAMKVVEVVEKVGTWLVGVIIAEVIVVAIEHELFWHSAVLAGN